MKDVAGVGPVASTVNGAGSNSKPWECTSTGINQHVECRSQPCLRNVGERSNVGETGTVVNKRKSNNNGQIE